MKALFLIGSFALFLSVAYGQLSANCQAEVDAIKNCLQAAHGGDESSDDDDEQNAEWEARKAAVDQCFANSSCENPADKFEAVMECNKKVFEEQIKPKLEACAGFPLPEFQGERGPKGHGLGHGFAKGKGKGKAKGLAKGKGKGTGKGKGKGLDTSAEGSFGDACPTEEAAQQLKDCLKDLKQQGDKKDKKEQRKGFREALKQKLEAVRQCFKENAISEECKAEQEEQKTKLCDCAESELVDDAEIEASLAACKADDDEDSDEDDDEEKPKQLQGLVKKFCQQGPKPGKGKGGVFKAKGKGKGLARQLAQFAAGQHPKGRFNRRPTSDEDDE